MIANTTQLITALLGDVLVAWLDSPAVSTLVCLLIVGYVFVLFARLINK